MRGLTKWVAGLAGAVLVLGACGAGTDAPAASTLVSASVDKTVRSTAHVTERIWLQHGHDSLELQSAEGDSDFDAHRSALRMHIYTSRVDPLLRDREFELVAIDGVAYMRMDWVTLPVGKQWVRGTDADVGVSAADDANIGSRDPADGLAYLNGVEHAREVGHENVGITPTTRYAVTMDLDHMLKVIRQGAKQISPSAARGLEALRRRVDIHHLPGAVWLDDAGRVRRFRYSFTGLVRGVDTVTDVEYSNFGDSVSVEAPSADTTVPIADVIDQLRGTGGGTSSGTGA